MALDGIFIKSIVDELKEILIDSKIDKINQPEKDEIILTIRKGRNRRKLLISASSNYPRLHLTNLVKQNPLKAPMYCMVLRKYLTNSKFISIDQIGNDRILKLTFESRDELGFDSIYLLYIEIMGRHSNISLVRQRDMMVMDSIKHLTPDNNSVRTVYPGVEFQLPPSHSKLNPYSFSKKEFLEKISLATIDFDDKYFMHLFSGVSAHISKHLYNEYIMNNKNFADKDELCEFCTNFFSSLNPSNYTYNIYSRNNKLMDFYCFDLKYYSEFEKNTYQSASELLEEYYYKKDKSDRLKNKSSSLNKIINNNISRCTKKEKILNKNLIECQSKELFRLKGELLTANIHRLKKGMKEIQLLNYYSEDGEKLNITLNEFKTPSENIQLYYKKYNKLKKAEHAAQEQLDINSEELEYLQSVSTHLENCETYDDIKDLRSELIESGYIKKKKSTKKDKSKPSKPLHFISSEGVDLYVGKNNIQNDYLTLKFAGKNDIWFHTKNIPGSHVILKHDERITDISIEEAGNLAAFYSKGQNSTKVPVDYTEIRNIKKPNGSKPGMVIYYTNKTMYIDPVKPVLQETK
ncbi:NFACT RNA binding domain-containing protein [Clostridium sediminicola]|uniref:Rqc2 family fibronectin-binding protein n=1 Tax=Clostridium sediminicola TaxID=3114879 RepID=UPI0031F27730